MLNREKKFLPIKDKWALDSQLGEMLRKLDQSENNESGFKAKFNALMREYNLNKHDVIEIVNLLGS